MGDFALGLGGLGSRFFKKNNTKGIKRGVVIRAYWGVVIGEYSRLCLMSHDETNISLREKYGNVWESGSGSISFI